MTTRAGATTLVEISDDQVIEVLRQAIRTRWERTEDAEIMAMHFIDAANTVIEYFGGTREGVGG